MISLKEFEAKNSTQKERENFLRTEIEPIIGETLTDMMIHKGFCSAPASTRFHGDYPGGLFEHSYNVTRCLLRYTERLGLKWTLEESPIKIGFLHDLCKTDIYVLDGEKYKIDNMSIVKGHGQKSVIYALRYGCKLNDEEIACILYHMGAYETDNWDAFDNAIRKYPNVLWTHTADMEASKIMGV